MKRAILLHGWEGRPDGGFRPWLRRELEARGYVVSAPAMPNPDFPVLEEWLAELSRAIGEPDGETVLVGHSLGCRAILHWLERLPEGKTVGKAVMVAGLVDALGGLSDKEAAFIRPWFDRDLDAAKIRRSAGKILTFFSDSDPFLPATAALPAAARYGAEVRFEPGMGHYNEESGVTEVPGVLAEILS